MEKIDSIDPRIYLILPEHNSNAHNIWNWALFVTQISNLSSDIKAEYPNDNNNNNNNNSRSDFKSQFNSIASSTAPFNLEQYQHRNDINNYYYYYFKHIFNNQTIMKIFKIKKRNKASLFNLIMPDISMYQMNNINDAAQHCKTHLSLCDYHWLLNNNDLINETTPWLFQNHKENNTQISLNNNNNEEYSSGENKKQQLTSANTNSKKDGSFTDEDDEVDYVDGDTNYDENGEDEDDDDADDDDSDDERRPQQQQQQQHNSKKEPINHHLITSNTSNTFYSIPNDGSNR